MAGIQTLLTLWTRDAQLSEYHLRVASDYEKLLTDTIQASGSKAPAFTLTAQGCSIICKQGTDIIG